MSISGFDLAQARYDGATPDSREYGDDPGTFCLEGDENEPCEDRTTCHLCDGVVCTEHDDTAECGEGTVHAACHDRGCWSTACAEDARDDALLARQDEDDER